jgi:hypothetical protein
VLDPSARLLNVNYCRNQRVSEVSGFALELHQNSSLQERNCSVVATCFEECVFKIRRLRIKTRSDDGKLKLNSKRSAERVKSDGRAFVKITCVRAELRQAVGVHQRQKSGRTAAT